jgi:hypothetical protein
MTESISIATSAMMVELNISCWTARKLDKRVSEEVDSAKNTKVKAGNYHKHLLAGNPHHEAVIRYAASCRLWNTQQTIPWSDSGPRIVTMENLFNGGYKKQLDDRKVEFERLTDVFMGVYPTLISAAAFQLGDLFNREEYPEPEAVAKKFRFNYTLTPIPTAGDFRIDIGEQAKAELVAQYETAFNERLNHAMRDVWQRLYECLTHMSERLASDDEGKRKVFHGTILTNARELINLLSRLNITNDPKLEEARRDLSAALVNTDIDTLKESDYIRENVKAKVDDILKRFEW